MLVPARLRDCSKALFCNTHEMMPSCSRTNCIHRHRQAPIRSILETHRERQTRSELAMQLRLRGTCANGTERDKICEELRRDGVEHFAGNGHALGGEVAEQFPAHTQALVDLEALIDVRVVDQTFPAHRCARFFQIRTHDDAEIILQSVGQLLEPFAVLDCRGWVVDGTRATDNKQAIILLGDDLGSFLTAAQDSLCSVGGRRQFR